MYDQLQAIEDRYEELGELLSDPAVISDTKRFMQLSKEEANTERLSKCIAVTKKSLKASKIQRNYWAKTWMQKWQKWLKKNYLT